MHYLVTGCAGFIGSHLIERLLEQGCHITAIDNFDPFYSRELKESNLSVARSHPAFRFFELDICDTRSLETLTGDYDGIIHLAAKAGVRPSLLDPVAYQRVNVSGTQHLLKFARRCGVPRFLFASSSSVYGINPNTPWSEEDAVLRPISPYASTKVSGELLGHVYSHLFGIRFIALRFFTVHGPRQRPDLAIRKFAQTIRKQQPIPVFGDGSTRRDYTFVGDIVEGIRAALDYQDSMYEVINLGCEQPVTLLELIREIESAVGERAVLEFHPVQPGDVPCTYADTRKAAALLGFRPKIGLKQGLSEFVRWIDRQTAPASTEGKAATTVAGV